MIAITGGLVLTEGGMIESDVVIEGGSIVQVGSSPEGVDVIDATGCLVGPGLVDLHTHLREPGQTWKEDIDSGTRAAARGGFTAVVAMPNTDPTLDSLESLRAFTKLVSEKAVVDVAPSAAMTLGRGGEELVDVEGLYEAGIRLFTDDGDALMDSQVLEELMERVATLDGAVIAQHAEDTELSAGGHVHAGDISKALGIGGLSSAAEYECVRRDLDLVRRTGVHYHCQHVSAAETVTLIAEAKAEGLPVTAEVTPHHLFFTDDDVATGNTNYKMYPPLRRFADREALRDAVESGVIDAVATDHAPHTSAEKSVALDEAPRGVIGLETAASAVWELTGDPRRFFDLLSVVPARIAGLASHGSPVAVGGPANLVVFDPSQSWVADRFVSKSSNSPFLGRVMKGKVVATVRHGEVVYRSGHDV